MKTQEKCRVCAGDLDPILSLGDLHVSNFPSSDEGDGIKAPLDLVLCRNCHLLQLKHSVPVEALYRNYWYRSGINRLMIEALTDISNRAEVLIHLRNGDAVLDIGCNDGTLLNSYKTQGIYKIGFDPAENLAVYSRTIADKVVTGFFGADPFFNDPDLKTHRPKIVTSIAMFYDLEDPGRFVADIKRVMHPEGVWIVQMSYLPLMLKQNAFDNICHEHLEYYSLKSFEYLLDLFEFEVVAVELNDVNGGSFRAYIRNKDADRKAFGDETFRSIAADQLRHLRDEEARSGLDLFETYEDFAFRIMRLKGDIVGFINEQKAKSKTVYVYGASTKGNTLLQYFGLDHRLIPAAAERYEGKWGKFTVGTRIPIISEEAARAAKPDYFLVLPWHFIDEFKIREAGYLRSGGRFIVPMPHFTII